MNVGQILETHRLGCALAWAGKIDELIEYRRTAT